MAVPYMAYCDGMASNKRRMVYRATGCAYGEAEDIVAKAVRKGWHDVLVAIVRQPLDNGRLERVLSALIFYDTPPYRAAQVAVMAHLDRVPVPLCGEVGAKLLARGDGDVCDAVLRFSGAQALAECARILLDNGEKWEAGGMVDLCLRRGADIHYQNGALMKGAMAGGDLALMDHLVARGFDLRLYQPALESYVRNTGVLHVVWVHLNHLFAENLPVEKAPAALPAAPAAGAACTLPDGGYLRSGDCVSRVDALAGGGTLTTVFNFATAQQIVIAHTGGQTGQPAVVAFQDILHDKALLEAAQAFVRQGGAPERVFAITLAPSARATVVGKPVKALPAAGQG